ncbi:hypothetical protein NL676_019093 [Syzygium grande]|nr:hypothetical protein NL676_019093 [Syzygium grande]
MTTCVLEIATGKQPDQSWRTIFESLGNVLHIDDPSIFELRLKHIRELWTEMIIVKHVENLPIEPAAA